MRVWLSVLAVMLLSAATLILHGPPGSGVPGYALSVAVLAGIFGAIIAGFLFIAKKINWMANKEALEALSKGLGAQCRCGFFVTDSIITGTYKGCDYHCQYVLHSKAAPQFIIRLMAATTAALCIEANECRGSGCKKVNISGKFATGDDDFDSRFKLMGQENELNRAALSNEQFRALIKRLFSYGTAFEVGDLSFGSKYIETTIYGARLKDITPEIVHDTLNLVIEMAMCAKAEQWGAAPNPARG
ncbi:MAG: hypothetical protein L7F77_00405 [Candidatus Magnetominusculus sp. LBB02]|nr:hypothetical protein [Candidatus Magnetominusculus sp. LBB02]